MSSDTRRVESRPPSRLSQVVLSSDTVFAVAMLILGWTVTAAGYRIDAATASRIFESALSVLSVMFGVFFAVLALIMSNQEDDFVAFMDETGLFQEMVWRYKWTFGALGISLLTTVLLTWLTAMLPAATLLWSSWCVVVVMVLFVYSVGATFQAAVDCIRYSERRARYIQLRRKTARQETLDTTRPGA